MEDAGNLELSAEDLGTAEGLYILARNAPRWTLPGGLGLGQAGHPETGVQAQTHTSSRRVGHQASQVKSV